MYSSRRRRFYLMNFTLHLMNNLIPLCLLCHIQLNEGSYPSLFRIWDHHYLTPSYNSKSTMLFNFTLFLNLEYSHDTVMNFFVQDTTCLFTSFGYIRTFCVLPWAPYFLKKYLIFKDPSGDSESLSLSFIS